MGRPARPWYWRERKRWVVVLKGKRRTLARGPEAKMKPDAMKAFHKLMLQECPEQSVEQEEYQVKDLFNFFLASVERAVKDGEKSPRTLNDYRRTLKRCVDVLGAMKAEDIRPHHVTRWVEQKPWGPTMRHNTLTVIRSAFHWAKRQGYLQADPLLGLVKPRPKIREAIPTKEQAEAALALAGERDPDFRDFLYALRQTGCRPSEIASVEAQGFDPAAGTWTVQNKTRGMTGEETRVIYLNPAMVALSTELAARWFVGLLFRNHLGRKWVSSTLSERFTDLRKSMGAGPELTSYGFRHLYITDALELGIPPATVAQLVGHKDTRTTLTTYNKISQRTEHLRAAVCLIRPDEGQGQGQAK